MQNLRIHTSHMADMICHKVYECLMSILNVKYSLNIHKPCGKSCQPEYVTWSDLISDKTHLH